MKWRSLGNLNLFLMYKMYNAKLFTQFLLFSIVFNYYSGTYFLLNISSYNNYNNLLFVFLSYILV